MLLFGPKTFIPSVFFEDLKIKISKSSLAPPVIRFKAYCFELVLMDATLVLSPVREEFTVSLSAPNTESLTASVKFINRHDEISIQIKNDTCCNCSCTFSQLSF